MIFILFFIFYNVVLVSVIPHESVIIIHIFSPSWASLPSPGLQPSKSSQSTRLGSLWNLDKWHGWTYLIGRSWDPDAENGFVDTVMGGVSGMNGVCGINIYIYYCVKMDSWWEVTVMFYNTFFARQWKSLLDCWIWGNRISFCSEHLCIPHRAERMPCRWLNILIC